MSGRIVNFETSAHQAIQELLPWFVTDRLEGGELEAVREHLAACPQCRADVDWQRRLRAAEPPVAVMPHADAGWKRMQSLLDEPAARRIAIPSRRAGTVIDRFRRLFPSAGNWMHWAMAGQFILIVGLGVMVAHLAGESAAYRDASFHVLGSSRNVSANMLVMFRPDLTEQDIRAGLQSSGARVVDGPTAAGAWMIHVDDAQLPTALEKLRAHPGVTLAEALTSGAGH
jgi:hypothetical protein